jgi:U3 small nucleolar RNA-associated protein 22
MDDGAGSEDSGEMSAMEEDEDQGEWGGIAASNEAISAEENYKGKKAKQPPTGEELRAIRDASDLFKSSSFKLQVCI